jgi:predicted dehydrogenase
MMNGIYHILGSITASRLNVQQSGCPCKGDHVSERIRLVVLGASKRSDSLYGPLLALLRKDVEFVGLWGRSEGNARALGEKYGVPWFTDLERLRDEVRPEAAIVSVGYAANGVVGRRVVNLGLHALLETPIAHDLADADAIISRANADGLKIEVAEQYYRRPVERIKRALIQAGAFGKVLTACNDFMGHGYHGVSLIRSYIGFDVPVVSVNGVMAQFSVTPHYAWISQTFGRREEQWEHAVLQFADSRLGFFNWSSIAYDSPLRWLRSTRFFAEKGMAVGDQLTLVTPDGKDPQPVFLERRYHNVGGMETLSEIIAHTQPEVSWRNPFRGYYMDDEMIAVADCLMNLVNAIRENQAPEYGPLQARTDQAVTLAMLESARQGGMPVTLKPGGGR